MPLTATLTQTTVSPLFGQPTFFELRLFNGGSSDVTATLAQIFVQLGAGANASLVGNLQGNVVAQQAVPLGNASLLPSLPITVKANSNASIAFGVLFTTSISGPAYQISAVVNCSDSTSAVPAALSITPSAFASQPSLAVLYVVAQGRFNDPNNSELVAAAA